MLLFLMHGCQKTEFMPPPEGDKVPYEDPGYHHLGALLAASDYTLFYQVWQQSNVDSMLIGKTPYTLLVPDNDALNAAGYTEAVISAMPANEADSLVWLYTINETISKENLAEAIGSHRAMSLLEHPNWFMAMPYSYDPTRIRYRYAHYLATENERLLINGVPVGDVAAAMPAANGYMWPLNRMVPKADQEFKTVVESDPRFSMLLALTQRSDSVHDARYRAFSLLHIGWDPGPEMDNLRAYYNTMALTANPYGQHAFNTLFLPVNEAFAAAGFDSVDELLEWNNRGPEFLFDPNTWQITGGGFPSDTLLSYHWDWGRQNLPYSGSWGKAPKPTPTVFYVNDLRDELLGNYLINNEVGLMEYVMPFQYGKDADGRVLVQLKGSDAPPATIIETINTGLGPIHVVDRLFIPKDFKLN